MESFASVHIRWMIRRDFPEVLAIERASHDDPWDVAKLLARLKERSVIGKVATKGDRIVGFMVYELRPHLVRLLDIAVHPDWRRRGVGTAMVGDLKLKLTPDGRRRIVVWAPDTCLAAHLFFRASGLLARSVVRRFFAGGDDAYVFTFRTRREPAVAGKVSRYDPSAARWS